MAKMLLMVDKSPNKFRLLPYAYFGSGIALKNQGKKQEALTDLRKSAELFQSQGDAKNFQKVTGIIQQLTNNTSVTADTQSTQSSIAGTYSCHYLMRLMGPGTLPLSTPSPLGKIQLDGRGRYSSKNFGTGNYIFDSSKGIVRFTDGKMADAVAAYSIDENGNPKIRFEPKLNPGINFDQSHYCPKVNT
ncbi:MULTISPECIES: hypothetical protein [Calothrix]|uniref:Tetratricopeptide repeat protein n=2 Tax=Calothrix TaxID=1186 RepID=A0ABR8AK14_9CYAN|nr:MULTISPECIES: hypothetical protein [Calothrix]MBD2200357.1 hypothetical protein [Calothrix parietina FACHB-288]MBD2229009.1 hypothetical protein [Calothrix anomala FACHB-343]